jgi:hypothetical protein
VTKALRRYEGLGRGAASEFHHTVPDVPVFRQMRGGNRPSAASDHLIKRAAMVKLRVKVTAEFTWPTGAQVETTGGSAIDMFHGRYLREGKDNFARFNRIFDCALFEWRMTMSLYYNALRSSTPPQSLSKTSIQQGPQHFASAI